MNAVAATGMGADTPPIESPRQMLTLHSCFVNDDNDDEDKCDYRADDEDEDEVNNSFNYIPVSAIAGDNGPSEDLDIEFAKQGSDVLVPTVGLETDAREFQEINAEVHTVIQETTVAKNCSYDDQEEKQEVTDNTHHKDKLMIVAVTTSSTTKIDRANVSTLECVATQDLRELRNGTSSYESAELETHAPADRQQSHDENDKNMTHDGKKEQTSAQNALSSTNEESLSDTGQPMEIDSEEDQVVETPPSVDFSRGSEDVKTGGVQSSKNEDLLHQSQIVPAIAAERQNAAMGSVNVMKDTKPVKAAKRKQSLLSRSDLTEIADEDSIGDGGGHLSSGSSIVSTQTHTPKRSRMRASPKKQRRSPSALKYLQTTPLRRSTRVKVESPKFTYPVKNLGDHHQVNRRGALSPAPSSPPAAMMQGVKSEYGSGQPGLASSLVHLMGTEALAAKLKHAFQRASFAGNAPISRFRQLIKDDVNGLRHLNVFNLLDAVNQLDGTIMQVHVKLPGVRRTTGQDHVYSVSKAKARSLESCPLRFSAPLRVAEHFIVPLAKELGLEYAMRQHTASLMSCPLEGAVFDWRFHRTETVVFQLGGKSIWKMRKSQVEYPLQCFHPDSWQLDDMANVAKMHRVATMDKATSGLLSTPDEDLDVFDEHGDQDAATQGHHLLKPGSVAYLPAGAWFEVKTKGLNALWIEVELASMTYENLVFSALKQLAWGDKQWRMGIQLYPGNRGQFKATRHHVEACLKSLRTEMTELEGGDLLPEYLGTEDMHDLVARGLIHDTSMSPNSTSFEVDLTNPKFKLKHEKVFKDAAYRVNPVAVIMSVAEIPHLPVREEAEPVDAVNRTSRTVRTPHCALKKTVKPKPKQKLTQRNVTHSGKHTYTLDELFGNDEFQSHLHVKFQCSAEHSRMVEWLRCRGSEPFDLEEFSSCDSTFRHGTSPARGEESARNLLRFLGFVGYITRLKMP